MPADVLTTAAPPVSPAEAAEVLRDHFGLEGRIEVLSSERDRNFRLRTGDGRAYVLKLANPAEPRAVTALQTALLRHVEAADPELPLPRVVAGRDGCDERSLVFGGAGVVVRLLTYLDGVPLASAPANAAQAHAIGQGLGRLDRALSGFRHAAADRDLLWDAGHVERVRPLVDHLPDAAERAFVHGLVDAFEAGTAPRLAGLRGQVIHNDLNPHNVLVDGADPTRLAGIIDVGDALTAPLVVDLGTALAYRMGAGDLDALHAFAAGFQAALPLTSAEIDLLPDLIRARMILTVVITGWRAAREPANRDYILRNNARAWRGLRDMAAMDRNRLADGLHKAMERGT